MPASLKIALALAVALPAVALRLAGAHVAPLLAVPLFGAAVVASAFLLVWAAEAARRDISGSLATAILAIIAVLPEYAVDLYFAWSAGHIPENAHYAAANMTGSNRLLLGLGWPFVAAVFLWGLRARKEPARPVTLLPERRLELGFLLVASAWSLVIPLTRRLAWYDALVLLALFGAYLFRAAQGEQHEPELVGAAERIGALPSRARRITVIAMLLAATAIVLCAAEPFAHALVEGGKSLGVDEFLLVQWLAPLASEAPELLVAALLAYRGRDDAALGTLLSSKVNQWTLLVGSLPIAYLAGGGTGAGLSLDARQTEEFVLTAAQTLMGLAVLLELRFSTWEAGALFLLFALQFPFPGTAVRLGFAAAYFAVALALFIRHRRELPLVLRAAAGRREG